ncbi:hypothetical protein EZV62_006006 [Acer yangbiense]|uniref:Pyruvate kinase n=1 Tax=Acer yangbiense TaxID=1000413 RepID=A0A5C7IP77_9ROSI|nr:hypothetical protein EZV62_006006 [Acer yangbiense]
MKLANLRCSSRSLFQHNRINIFSYSSQTNPHQPLVRKTFFKSNTNDGGLITRLCNENKFKEAIQLLYQIKQPSALAYSNLVQFCRQNHALEEGRRVHAHMKSSGFKPGVVISNRLLDMYAKCECLSDAQKLFDVMNEKDLCSYNIMISGYAKVGFLERARKLFDEMRDRDNFSWTAMISGYVRYDKPLEALELYRNEVVWSALSDMYGKCGNINEARRIFDKMVDRDVVSWTAMIGRYFEEGRREEGFVLFSKLMKSGIRPNEFTFAGVLNACVDHAAEELGKQVHAYMTRIGFDPYSFAASALVHMYSKCGNVENAKRVFDGIPRPDIVSWTALITGYARNGLPDKAIEYFDLLLKSGTQPDHIVFVGVLSACTHAGLVDKALEYFRSIKEKHGLTHTADHYACIVDLLARSGRFEEAEGIISKMPTKPNKFFWASLLGGCRSHGNLELAKHAVEALFEIEPENPATYTTMNNIYATASRLSDVAKIRKRMGVQLFLVGDTSHPQSKEMHEFLVEISKKMKEEGYVPDTNFVLQDVEDEEQVQNFSYHSEMLAVASGIIATPPETIIKVFKNLRTCVDCHTAIKFISKMYTRKIFVRDSNRFHHFKDGNCSCGDSWFPLKAVKVMHTVSLRTEATIPGAGGTMPPNLGQAFKEYFGPEMFKYRACDVAVTENCPDKHERKQYFRLVMNELLAGRKSFSFANGHNCLHFLSAEKDWDDIKFGVDNKVDFYAVSFVKDAQVVHELKNYLKSCNADIHVIVKIESADSIPNLHSIITASDGAMVARGDLGAELPIEEVPLLQEEIIRICRRMGKAVIVATNMLESMIVHPTPTRAEVSDIAIAVREGADAVMLSRETAHGKFPLKAVKVMHTVSLRTEATYLVLVNHMSEMFAYHATMMSNTLGTSIVVFTKTGFMAILLSHYRPSGTIFAFTNDKTIQQRLSLYQGVCPIYMQFSDDAEETFENALGLLQKQGMVKEGEEVALVQSGRQPIWRFQSTHNIQVRQKDRRVSLN